MPRLDDIELHDLPAAGRILCRDPARLAREMRLGRVPGTRVDGVPFVPTAWVESAAGIAATDEESVRGYWLSRLAPPSAAAFRPRRDRARLPAEALLSLDDAAQRLLADRRAVERLVGSGELPPLRVDGAVWLDETLVDLLAARADGAGDDAAIAERLAAVQDWARFDHATTDAAAPAARASAPATTATPSTTDTSAPAPAAFEIPRDLALDDIAPLAPTSDLIDADGFETIDED